MNPDNKHDTCTNNAFSVMEEGIASRTFARKIRKVLSSIMLFLLLLFLVLFFTLPCFLTKGMTVNGLVNFSREDILQMAKVDSYCPNMFLNEQSAKKDLLSSSQGLILDCDFQNLGITSSCDIQEDYPVATYQEEIYFSSGFSLQEGREKLSQLPLSDQAKSKIDANFSSFSSDKLPKIHFPKGVKGSLEEAKEAFSLMKGIKVSSLTYIVGIQFINDNGDTNWSNIASLLVKNQEHYYLVNGVQTYHFSDYVVYFGDSSFNNIEAAITNQKIQPSSFSFQGEEEIFKVYEIDALYNDKEGRIRYVVKGENNE